jgi:hypothetical protein
MLINGKINDSFPYKPWLIYICPYAKLLKNDVNAPIQKVTPLFEEIEE